MKTGTEALPASWKHEQPAGRPKTKMVLTKKRSDELKAILAGAPNYTEAERELARLLLMVSGSRFHSAAWNESRTSFSAKVVS